MFKPRRIHVLTIADKEIVVSGILPRVARLGAEYHEYLDDVDGFLSRWDKSGTDADIFTFLQPISDSVPKHSYPCELDSISVLSIDTYEKWWKGQISDKTRNMVRKAGKKGVTTRLIDFDDELVKGIEAIYNESRLRQGKPFKHYGKDFDALRRAHATYLERSVFLGAFHEEILIGFVKMILQESSASIMQIISMFAQRDKAPTNALLAKAVEICAGRGIRFLQYGAWSRRSLGDFKLRNGFKRFELPRYLVPLTLRGRIAIGLKLHRNLRDFIPGEALDFLVSWRARWFASRHKAQAQGL